MKIPAQNRTLGEDNKVMNKNRNGHTRLSKGHLTR